MKYELGNMDYYHVAMARSVIGSMPVYKVQLDEKVDGDRLKRATRKALSFNPLFATKFIYEGKYMLETNEEDFEIIHCDMEHRPLLMGKGWNGNHYWQVCYFQNEILLECFHAISDGRGILRFFQDILECYYEVPKKPFYDEQSLACGYEQIYDKKVKSFGLKKQKPGFHNRHYPHEKNGDRCTMHTLTVNTKELLTIAKKMDASPAAVIAPIFSKTIHSRLPAKAKNRDVSCGIIVDCRKPFGIQCQHNFIYSKGITYESRFDKFELDTLGTIYRTLLDMACQKENLISECTSLKRYTDFVYHLKPRWLNTFANRVAARITKNVMNNFNLTYIGKLDFDQKVMEHVKDFDFYNWPDIGYCVLSVVDVKGKLKINIGENYCDPALISAFIKQGKEFGVKIHYTKTFQYHQGRVKL